MPAQIESDRRGSRIAFAALALISAIACSDDPLDVEEELEPQVASIVITAGTSTATVSATGQGAQTGTLTLRQNEANLISFRFVDARGQDEAVIVADRDDFELRPGAPMPTSVSLTSTGGSGATFTATITPTVAGQVSIPFVLFNTHHGHAELSRVVVATVAP